MFYILLPTSWGIFPAVSHISLTTI